jgi:predicted HD phosphohydrolase
MRDKYKDHKYFNKCAEFCAKYDQNSFDPDYDSYDLDFFVPMVEEVFKAPKKSIYSA